MGDACGMAFAGANRIIVCEMDKQQLYFGKEHIKKFTTWLRDTFKSNFQMRPCNMLVNVEKAAPFNPNDEENRFLPPYSIFKDVDRQHSKTFHDFFGSASKLKVFNSV
jgi:hypothetical protein